MDDLDVATKVLLREDPLAMVRLVCPHLHVRRACLEPTERVRLHRFQDCLVRAYVQELGWVWFHFEAIARWRSSVPRATFEYWCLAWPTHRPLLSVVLVQKPDRRQARAPRARLTVRFGELEVARFQALTVPLWELPRSKLRAAPALLCWRAMSSRAGTGLAQSRGRSS